VAAPATRGELRTFGLTLGGVCLLWAAVLFWRGESGGARWFLGAAPVLALAALAAPGTLRPVHRVWMPVTRAVARGLTWVMLTVVFLVVFTPYGVVSRLLGRDPLEQKIDRRRASYWIRRHDGPFDPDRLTKQY
jgi:Saxitoxin biosynthesis operon protein SxtJ